MNGLVWISQSRCLLRDSLHLWNRLHDKSVYENFYKFRKGKFI